MLSGPRINTVRFGVIDRTKSVGSMLIVDQSGAAPAEGMMESVRDLLPRDRLDALAYKARALREFDRATRGVH
jgi:hypothetical protein